MSRAEFREPWSILAPAGCDLSRLLPIRAEHIMPFHIVAAGGCWLSLKDEAPVWLAEGDAVLLPYGDGHGLNGREAAAAVEASRLLPPPPWADILVVEHGGLGANTSVICGFLQCDELLFHPLLRHLPRVLHVNSKGDEDRSWLSHVIRHTAAEASRPSPGSRSMLPRLTELMFVEIIRKLCATCPPKTRAGSRIKDPVAGAASRWRHARAPNMKDWSVEELSHWGARCAACWPSASVRYLDQAAIRYLAEWRLASSAAQLKTDRLPIKAMADLYGYEFEAAFNRAFKRCFRPAARRLAQAPGSAVREWRGARGGAIFLLLSVRAVAIERDLMSAAAHARSAGARAWRNW